MNKAFFITTPIFYVNHSPHIGHLYTALIADVTQRFQRLQGNFPIIFSTGTDEHGLKVQQASQLINTNPKNFCDSVSAEFKSVFDYYSIEYSDYLRTTEKRHKDCVSKFFETIKLGGFIYQGQYEGWYSIADETFFSSKQVVEKVLKSGEKVVVSKETGHPVLWSNETNYMFKLSQFKDDLLYWLKEDKRIVPSHFQDELKLWISNDLQDLSISRPRSRVPWGIPVPGDESHNLYVWLDALANYLTVAGYPDAKLWPPNLQVIGKDILRFHGIYWPAFLMAAKLKPPDKLLVHSHWKVDGVKMSKSLRNVVCPVKLSQNLGSDAVRYALLKFNVFHSDGSWNEKQIIDAVNADLANTLGNLLRRCMSPSLNPKQTFPLLDDNFVGDSSPTCKLLLEKIDRLHDDVGDYFESFNYHTGINTIMSMAYTANLFIDEEKPWKLKTNPDRRCLESILYIGMATIRAAAIALQPIVPQYAEKLLNALDIPLAERMWVDLKKDYRSVFSSSSQMISIIPFVRIKT